jgi:hypothetical protein
MLAIHVALKNNARKTYLSLVSLFRIRKLDEGGSSQKESTEQSQHCASPQRKPRVRGVIKIPETGNIQGIPNGTDGDCDAWCQQVDGSSGEPGTQSKETIKNGIGIIGNVSRRRFTSPSTESSQGNVKPWLAEENTKQTVNTKML